MTSERAMQLIEVCKWSNGMCGCITATKPPYTPMTEAEKDWLWKRTPSHSFTANTLSQVAKGKIVAECF